MSENHKKEVEDIEIILAEALKEGLKQDLKEQFENKNPPKIFTPSVKKKNFYLRILLANAAIGLLIVAFVLGFESGSDYNRAIQFLNETHLNYLPDVERNLNSPKNDENTILLDFKNKWINPKDLDDMKISTLSNRAKMEIGYHLLTNERSLEVVDRLFQSIENENTGLKSEKLWLWGLCKMMIGENKNAIEYFEELKNTSMYKNEEVNLLLNFLNE